MEDTLNARARRCWQLMDDNERTAVRIGMSPLWVTQTDLGGKATGELWPGIRGDEHRLLALALFACAKNDGGMIA